MNTLNILKIIGVLVILQFSSGRAAAQDSLRAGRVGMSASVQSGQFDVLVPIWLSSQFSISPAVGIAWAEDNGSDVRIGVVPRFFFNTGKIAPFIGGRIGLLHSSPKSANVSTDWIVGLAGGGEYFLDEHFSFGVESQLNLLISDVESTRFGNPGKYTINTGAAVFATIYF